MPRNLIDDEIDRLDDLHGKGRPADHAFQRGLLVGLSEIHDRLFELGRIAEALEDQDSGEISLSLSRIAKAIESQK